MLERLLKLHPKVIDLSQARIARLLAALDHPEARLPPVIHVAGTNGKGSVVAYLRAMLEAAGYRVHAYISPHLVRFHERIRLAGALIDEAHLIDVLEECRRANGEAPITFFEITTAAAMLAFARTPADAVLLEVGLGGRLDATNVIRRPAVAVITPVSLDHQSYLGDTVAAIAGEKAGILKPRAPAVIAPQVPEALAVIEARARQVGATLWRAEREWTAAREGEEIAFAAAGRTTRYPLPGLPGAHQIDNAGTALAALDRLPNLVVDRAQRAAGLRAVEWPARLQRLGTGRLVDARPAGWEVWLDGGHNPAAGEMLGRHAEGWRDRPLYLVFGMMGTKDAQGFLRPLAARAQAAIAVPVPRGDHALTPADGAAAAAAAGFADVRQAVDVRAALADLFARYGAAPGRVLIAGSLYLAGAVLAENG